MREDARTGVYVENLSEVEVHGVQDVIHLLIQVIVSSSSKFHFIVFSKLLQFRLACSVYVITKRLECA